MFQWRRTSRCACADQHPARGTCRPPLSCAMLRCPPPLHPHTRCTPSRLHTLAPARAVQLPRDCLSDRNAPRSLMRGGGRRSFAYCGACGASHGHTAGCEELELSICEELELSICEERELSICEELAVSICAELYSGGFLRGSRAT